MDKIKSQTVYTEVPVSERLPEQMFNVVNHGDGFKTAYFHKDAHISEQWSDDTSGRRLTFPDIWLEKKEDQIVMSESQFNELTKQIAGDAFQAGVDWRNGIIKYGAVHNPYMDKDQYINSFK